MLNSHVIKAKTRETAALLLIALWFLPLLSACRKAKRWTEEQGEVEQRWKPDSTVTIVGLSAEAIRSALEATLAAPRPPLIRDAEWKSVRSLYRTYGDVLLWLPNGTPDARAQALVSEIAKSPTHGLRVKDLPIPALNQALQALRNAEHPTAEQVAEADVLMSATYAALAHDLLSGQIDPSSLSQDWHINPNKVDVDSALAQRLQLEPLDRAIAQLRPADPDYDALREQLEHYRALRDSGGWTRVADGRALKPGEAESRTRLQALLNRLKAESYLAPDAVLAEPNGAQGADTTRAAYDATLAGAVASFQAHHGIVVDSILGTETVASLNVPASYRLGQLAANLERFRWLPRDFGSRYILVNVPGFRLDAYDSGKKVLEMKVIVGAEYENRNTPVFSDSMQYVVFRPYWLVPDAIAAKEIWPKAQNDSTYLARNSYETYTDHGQTRVRQLPGGKNALGFVKFMFPNDFNIYLHDTPQGDLFAKDIRAFSHGCIRVEQPRELAEWVLGWSPDRVEGAMTAGPDNKTVNLPRKIPVYIVYLTTYMRDGELYFGNDLYDRDDALVKQLADGATPTADELRELQELQRLTAP